MAEQPTKAWIEAQINKCVQDIHRNEGAVLLLKQMLENEIFVQERAKEGTDANSN